MESKGKWPMPVVLGVWPNGVVYEHWFRPGKPRLHRFAKEESYVPVGRVQDLRDALEQLQNGPDTLTPDGLKIVNEALSGLPDSEREAEGGGSR